MSTIIAAPCEAVLTNFGDLDINLIWPIKLVVA